MRTSDYILGQNMLAQLRSVLACTLYVQYIGISSRWERSFTLQRTEMMMTMRRRLFPRWGA